jgi:hypothetical protein
MRLGNFIELITKYTGIKFVVEKTAKLLGYESCGCENRRDNLNDIELW